MMADNLQLIAEIRKDVGKGASRRLRHDGVIPAIVYGADKDPQMLILKHNKVIKALENDEYFSQIITLDVAGDLQKVVLKDMQRHVFKPKIMHMDFLRIKASEKITMLIPLHFSGEAVAPGVKLEGGSVSHAISEVEVRCLPADLPKNIEVDVSNMNLNDTLHLTDLKLPENVELTMLAQGEEFDQPVVTIHLTRIEEAPVEVEVEEVEAEEGAEAEEGNGEGKE